MLKHRTMTRSCLHSYETLPVLRLGTSHKINLKLWNRLKREIVNFVGNYIFHPFFKKKTLFVSFTRFFVSYKHTLEETLKTKYIRRRKPQDAVSFLRSNRSKVKPCVAPKLPCHYNVLIPFQDQAMSDPAETKTGNSYIITCLENMFPQLKLFKICVLWR